MKYKRRNVKQEVGYIYLEFIGNGLSRDINLSIIVNTEVLLFFGLRRDCGELLPLGPLMCGKIHNKNYLDLELPFFKGY